MKKISDRISYVGVNDDDKVLFEGLWPIPAGVSYNSYVVTDEKIALIDTVESGFEEEFINNIAEATAGRPVDYLVVNHMRRLAGQRRKARRRSSRRRSRRYE